MGLLSRHQGKQASKELIIIKYIRDSSGLLNIHNTWGSSVIMTSDIVPGLNSGVMGAMILLGNVSGAAVGLAFTVSINV